MKRTTSLFASSAFLYVGASTLLAGLGALISVVAFERVPYLLGTFVGGVLFVVCLFSTFTDILRRKIYNVVVYPAFVLIAAANFVPTFFPEVLGGNVERLGAIGFGPSALGAFVCFAVVAAPYALGQGGAGDVKLAATIGAAFGAGDGVFALAFAYVFASVFALVVLTRKVGPLALYRRLFRRRRPTSERTNETLMENSSDHSKESPLENSLKSAIEKSIENDDENDDVFKMAIPMAPGFFASVAGLLVGCWQRLCGIPLDIFLS